VSYKDADLCTGRFSVDVCVDPPVDPIGILECQIRRSASRTAELDHPFGGDGHSYRSASTGLARATRSACPETVAIATTSAKTLVARNTSGFKSM